MRTAIIELLAVSAWLMCSSWAVLSAEGADTARHEIVLADMSRCKPAAALTDLNKKHHWRLVSYTTVATKFNGIMICAGQASEAPPVVLPLDVKGWYSVYVGYWNPIWAYDSGTAIRLKLTGEPSFMPIVDPDQGTGYTGTRLTEAFWKDSDLTGRDLVIGQREKKAFVAYIRLVPLSDEQVRDIKADRQRKSTRFIVAANDGDLSGRKMTTREDIVELVERYRHSDVAKLIWNVAYGDMTNYPSKVGYLLSTGEDGVGNHAEEMGIDNLKALLSKGIVPAQVALEHAHRLGMKFDIYFRMAIQGSTPPFQLHPKSLVRRHPEFRIVSKNGVAVSKASYAFPQTRQFMLSLIREATERFDVDGVQLCFIRGPEYIGYEQPVVDDFKKKYGEDPRSVAEDDPRLLELRAGYVTELVRGVRRLIDEISSNKGKKIELDAIVYWSIPLNLAWNMDVETWIKENLLDSVTGASGKLYDLAKAHGCKRYWGLGGRSPENYIRKSLAAMRNEADGLFVWDMDDQQDHLLDWQIIRRAGHRKQLEVWEKRLPELPQAWTTTLQLLTVGGVDVTQTTTNPNGRILWLYSGG